MTSQCETSGKYNINLLSKNLEPPEYNLPTRERTLTGTSSILAGSKSRVLPTDAFFTKYNYRAGRAVLTVISWACTAHETTHLTSPKLHLASFKATQNGKKLKQRHNATRDWSQDLQHQSTPYSQGRETNFIALKLPNDRQMIL